MKMIEKKYVNKITRKTNANKWFAVTAILLLLNVAFIVGSIFPYQEYDVQYSQEIGVYYYKLKIADNQTNIAEALYNLHQAIEAKLDINDTNNLFYEDEQNKVWVHLLTIENSLAAINERSDWLIGDSTNLTINGMTQDTIEGIYDDAIKNALGTEHDIRQIWMKENYNWAFIYYDWGIIGLHIAMLILFSIIMLFYINCRFIPYRCEGTIFEHEIFVDSKGRLYVSHEFEPEYNPTKHQIYLKFGKYEEYNRRW